MSLHEATGVKSDVILMTSYDNRFDVYPDNAESMKEVQDLRNKINFYKLDRKMSTLSCSRITPNMTSTEVIWNLNFESTNETIMSYVDSRATNQAREAEISIGGKLFKKFEGRGSFLAVLTIARIDQSVMLYLVDSETGNKFYTRKITEKLPAKVPLMNVYDNLVTVVLPADKEHNDEIIMIEVFIAPEMAGREYKGDIKKNNLAELIYPILTNVEIDWKIFGLQTVRVDNNDYLISVDENNNLRTIEIGKLKRGQKDKANESNSKKNKLPDNLIFRPPITIEYDQNTKNMIIHGLDIYSTQFP